MDRRRVVSFKQDDQEEDLFEGSQPTRSSREELIDSHMSRRLKDYEEKEKQYTRMLDLGMVQLRKSLEERNDLNARIATLEREIFGNHEAILALEQDNLNLKSIVDSHGDSRGRTQERSCDDSRDNEIFQLNARLSSTVEHCEALEQVCAEVKKKNNALKKASEEMEAGYQVSMKYYEAQVAEVDREIKGVQEHSQTLVRDLAKSDKTCQSLRYGLNEKRQECERLQRFVEDYSVEKTQLLESNNDLQARNNDLEWRLKSINGKFVELQSKFDRSQRGNQEASSSTESGSGWGLPSVSAALTSVYRTLSPSRERPGPPNSGLRRQMVREQPVGIDQRELQLTAVSVSSLPTRESGPMRVSRDIVPEVQPLSSLIPAQERIIVERQEIVPEIDSVPPSLELVVRAVSSPSRPVAASRRSLIRRGTDDNLDENTRNILGWIDTNDEAYKLYRDIQTYKLGGYHINFGPVQFDATEFKESEKHDYVASSSSVKALDDGFIEVAFIYQLTGSKIKGFTDEYFQLLASVIFRSGLKEVLDLKQLLLKAESDGHIKLPTGDA